MRGEGRRRRRRRVPFGKLKLEGGEMTAGGRFDDDHGETLECSVDGHYCCLCVCVCVLFVSLGEKERGRGMVDNVEVKKKKSTFKQKVKARSSV